MRPDAVAGYHCTFLFSKRKQIGTDKSTSHNEKVDIKFDLFSIKSDGCIVNGNELDFSSILYRLIIDGSYYNPYAGGVDFASSTAWYFSWE
jgi:hypothetical protein